MEAEKLNQGIKRRRPPKERPPAFCISLLKVLRESVPLLAQVFAAAFEHVDAQAERLVILVGEAATGGMAAGAVLLVHSLVVC